MNKNNNYVTLGLRLLGLAAYIGLTIVTCAGVWNGKQEPFAICAAIALLVVDLVAVAMVGRNLNPDGGQKQKEG